MPLSREELAALSGLLDQALDLPPADVEPWLAALPAEQQALLPLLREMLEQHARRSGSLLSRLPQLSGVDDDEAAEGQPGQRVGAYRLLREIGRGGMGSVWLAERADGIFQRQVALKLPRLAKSPRLAERMAREREIGALLEHPNIARLYDAGIDDGGRPYLVMELVQGVQLLEFAQLRRLDCQGCLALMLQVCAAVAHAHRLLVVHRDIKPSNLMVDEAGQVKLLDFGIARLLDVDGGSVGGSDESPRTHTPRYAAPEQLRGGALGTATDVYSLGVVLHELLTGGLPQAGQALAPTLGQDLRAVLQRALRVDPGDRYSSVERLADDLQRVIALRPVQAAPVPLGHRLALFARRHRWALGVGGLGAFVLALSAAVVIGQQAREAEQERRASQARKFLFDVLEEVEPAAGQPAAQITGLQMLQGALARARQAYADQPVLRAQVLTELGILFRRMQQPEQALQLLREALALLEQSAAADDPALHIARAQMALQLLVNGGPQTAAMAQTLAGQALAGCRAETARCAKAQTYALDALQGQATRRGDASAALQHAQAAVQAAARAFGPDHGEVALLLLKVAVLQRNQGELAAAARTVDEARAIGARATLRRVDGHELRLTSALVWADVGRHDAALAELEAMLAEPDIAARRAFVQRLRAQSLVAQGLLDAALAAADAALASADPTPAATPAVDPATRNRWEATFARQARARALSGLGRHDDARREIAAVADGLRGLGLPEAGIEQLRARRFAGEIELRAGQDARSRALLTPLQALHRRAAPAPVLAPVDLAQVLDLLGCLDRREGKARAAQTLHSQAGQLLGRALPPGHPLRLRNALLQALAQWLADGAGARAELQRSAKEFADTLPPGSAWRQLPAAQTAAVADWQSLVP